MEDISIKGKFNMNSNVQRAKGTYFILIREMFSIFNSYFNCFSQTKVSPIFNNKSEKHFCLNSFDMVLAFYVREPMQAF
jgi:hypothetical protein